MDALLLALANVSGQLIPILGAVALVFLCILLKKAGDLVVQITATVKSLDPTISGVDQSIAKLQAPLDTVVRVSHAMDGASDKAGEVVKKMADYASEGLAAVKGSMPEEEEVNEDE